MPLEPMPVEALTAHYQELLRCHDSTDAALILARDLENNILATAKREIAYLRAQLSGGPGTKEANALLIAAAPDLLAVCERLLADIDNDYGVFRSSLVRAAQDAVNKAYGYQPTSAAVWWTEWRGG